MKNHWIEQYRKKKAKFWTAEFVRNGVFVLKPRRVGVAKTPNYCKILFIDSMFAQQDHELMDFLTECHQQGMSSMYARLRFYQGLLAKTELENFELTDLKYFQIGMGITPDDIKFEFSYKHEKRQVLK